jgi:hypothetical protein
MSTQELAGRNISLHDDCDLSEEGDIQSLLSALRELLDRLSGRDPDGPRSRSDEVESWEGGEFLYVETALVRTVDAEIDVNIQGGRAFIRMARQDNEADQACASPSSRS